ncbi:Arabinose 5-phosphate isomerase KdsD [Poriferisphaera corsica]|uniref:Arabinose 5-phosphate isomerase KdsD n=1 Tax=Poriferisphaera corsica TaxID=2528020 RepID=A0A517YR83_9BACT|nr:KpsF/GutQ family sugar-phosphate isomerase [Poriferisphaera corsica]QDU32737.1 Arabinose 5-phosphate isomerase KdsD [Poriferisphaera corsica]
MTEMPKETCDGVGNKSNDQRFAEEVLRVERETIGRLVLGDAFHAAVKLVLEKTGGWMSGVGGASNGGSLVISGMGKSGLIGQKLSATFASTGTASHFLHPSEAMHGDLGKVQRGDVVMILSYGGNTEEVVSLASLLRQDDVPVIAMVGTDDCELARLSEVVLEVGDITEACPLNLAPTASTTAMLALGDALALTVSRRRDFGVDDFKRVHPGGGLGRQLMPVVQAMRFKVGENLPLVNEAASVREAFEEADAFAAKRKIRRTGAILVVNDIGELAGIFTDADFRRLAMKGANQALGTMIKDAMTKEPRKLGSDSIVRDAVHLVRELRIDEIPVVDGANRPVGLVDVQDLIALKVIEG